MSRLAVLTALLACLVSTVAMAQEPIRVIWIDYDNDQGETIVLFNPNPEPINITAYRIESAGGQTFRFDWSGEATDIFIGGFDVVRVHSGPCGPSEDTRDFRWRTSEGEPRVEEVWRNEGDVAYLYDRREGGIPIDSYSYPNAN